MVFDTEYTSLIPNYCAIYPPPWYELVYYYIDFRRLCQEAQLFRTWGRGQIVPHCFRTSITAKWLNQGGWKLSTFLIPHPPPLHPTPPQSAHLAPSLGKGVMVVQFKWQKPGGFESKSWNQNIIRSPSPCTAWPRWPLPWWKKRGTRRISMLCTMG